MPWRCRETGYGWQYTNVKGKPFQRAPIISQFGTCTVAISVGQAAVTINQPLHSQAFPMPFPAPVFDCLQSSDRHCKKGLQDLRWALPRLFTWCYHLWPNPLKCEVTQGAVTISRIMIPSLSPSHWSPEATSRSSSHGSTITGTSPMKASSS